MRYCVDEELIKQWLHWSFQEGQKFMTGFDWSWDRFRSELEKRERLKIPEEATHWAKVGQMSKLIYETKLLCEI